MYLDISLSLAVDPEAAPPASATITRVLDLQADNPFQQRRCLQ
jgi:hypothetical protein